MKLFATSAKGVATIAVCLSLAFATFALSARRGQDGVSPGDDVARVVVAPDGVQWQLRQDFESAVLLVVGPQGPTFQKRFSKEEALWLGVAESSLPDGRYTWEIRIRPQVPSQAVEELRLVAENGGLDPTEKAKHTEAVNQRYRLRHRDLMRTGQFFVQDGIAIADPNDDDGLDLNKGVVNAATSNPDTPRSPSAAYDVSGNWTVTGALAVGTDFPIQPIDIYDSEPAIALRDSDGGSSWHLYGDSGGFDIRSGSKETGNRVFFVAPNAPNPSLWIDGTGKWGSGTALPSAPLHLLRSDGTARILIQEQSPVPLSRTLFELQNNGGTFFSLRNTQNGTTWSFSVSSTGSFQIDNPNLGAAAEMVFLANGTVRMGPGGSQKFLLDPTGNLTLGGNLTAAGMLYPSDRNIKENVVALDGVDTLDRLSRLPIGAWNYKSDASTRHVGPMAQDFLAAFDLGSDGARINSMDATGLSLSAIQGLYELVKKQQEEIRELRSRLDGLEKR